MGLYHTRGKLMQVTPIEGGQSPNGRTWKKCQIIIQETITKDAVMNTAFGCFGEETIEQIERFKPGDEVAVTFSVRSREYNGKWFTDVNLYKLETPGEAAAARSAKTSAQASAAVKPAVKPTPKPAPAPAAAEEETDDLPF